MISLFPASTHPSRLAGSSPFARVQKAKANLLVRRSLGEGGCSKKMNQDVPQYAAARGIAVEEALAKGMEEKSNEIAQSGSEVDIPA